MQEFKYTTPMNISSNIKDNQEIYNKSAKALEDLRDQ